MLKLFLSLAFASSIVELPKNCFSNLKTDCLIKAENDTALNWRSHNIYLYKNSYVKLSVDQLEFIKGSMVFKGTATIQSAYAEFSCSDCLMQLKSLESEVEFSLYEGKSTYKNLASETWQDFPTYYRVRIRGLTAAKAGQVEGVVQTLSWQNYQENLFAFIDLKNKYEPKKEEYETLLRDQRFISSRAYHQAIESKQQSLIRDQQAQQMKRKKWLEEREAMRSLYRKKHYLEVD